MGNLSISLAAAFETVDWATLLVSVQAGASRDEALTLLRNTAEAADLTLQEVAELVVDGQVTFDGP